MVFKQIAAWMVAIVQCTIPASEQALRPTELAAFIDEALRVLPPGTQAAAPALLWQAVQGSNIGQQAGRGKLEKRVQVWLPQR